MPDRALSPIPRLLEERAYQQEKTECNDGDADWCGDDADGYGYTGGHECKADDCADDAARKFEYECYDAPDGVERPEGPGYLFFFTF